MRLLHGGIWLVTLSLLGNSAVLTAQQRSLALDPARNNVRLTYPRTSTMTADSGSPPRTPDKSWCPSRRRSQLVASQPYRRTAPLSARWPTIRTVAPRTTSRWSWSSTPTDECIDSRRSAFQSFSGISRSAAPGLPAVRNPFILVARYTTNSETLIRSG